MNKFNLIKAICVAGIATVIGTVCGLTTTYAAEGQNIAINETNFPDERFREHVANYFDINKDGVFSPDEIEAATSLSYVYSGTTSFLGKIHITELSERVQISL